MKHHLFPYSNSNFFRTLRPKRHSSCGLIAGHVLASIPESSKQKRIAYALAHKGAHKDINLAGN